MQCKNCDCCKLGYFKNRPNDYVCTGVKHPFVIFDINNECTEYPDCKIKTAKIYQPDEAKAFVGDTGIYVPGDVYGCHKMLISRELFVEAYNKWIKGAGANE